MRPTKAEKFSGPEKSVEVTVRGLGRVPTTQRRVGEWHTWLKSPAGREWQETLNIREKQDLQILYT